MKDLQTTITDKIGRTIAVPLTEDLYTLWKIQREDVLHHIENKGYITTAHMLTIGSCYGYALLNGAKIPPCTGCAGGDWKQRTLDIEKLYQVQKKWYSIEKGVKTRKLRTKKEISTL